MDKTIPQFFLKKLFFIYKNNPFACIIPAIMAYRYVKSKVMNKMRISLIV